MATEASDLIRRKWYAEWPADMPEAGVTLMAAPKLNAAGLHPVLLGVEDGSDDGHDVRLAFLAPEGEIETFSNAYLDSREMFEIGDFTFRRSHSPGAGLDKGPYAGKGFGFILYSTLALNAALLRRTYAGVGSPEGGASYSAERMWENLVSIGVAENETPDSDDYETDTYEHCERIRDSDFDDGERNGTIVDDEVCGKVTVEFPVNNDPIRYLPVWNLLASGWLLDWAGSRDWYERITSRYSRDERKQAKYLDWKADPEVLVRLDPGPDATTAQILFLAERVLALSDFATQRRFLSRPDIYRRLPTGAGAYSRGDVPTRMSFMSGVGRHAASRLAAAAMPARPEPLPAPSAQYRAKVATWAKLDLDV